MLQEPIKRDDENIDHNQDTNESTTILDRAKSAIQNISSRYSQWHDFRTGQKDENYFSWLGWQVVIWGLVGTFLWAALAPIDKGVSTAGFVITDSNRKAIQPAFSGIVDDIFVKEGQKVRSGEVLVKLNPINARAQANATREVIDGMDAQVVGLSKAISQKQRQSDLLEKQLIELRELAAEGYMARNKVLELERQQLQLKASIIEDEGNLIRAKKQANEQREKLNSLDFDLANTELKSPVDGQVVNITIFTKGGVVSPGQKVLEVIPLDENLIVEAQLPVHLVDKVRVGQSAEMLFTAFNVNRTPHIPGEIFSVGADRIVDEKSGVPYFKIQARATPKGIKLLGDLKVRPGMPVELFIKTGEQTLMTYLLKPVIDRAHSGMRED